VAELNNMVAGDAFRRMADHWRSHGLEDGDVPVAKQLRLTPKEIADAREGIISDETYRKIVQNGVKITQFVTEDPHRQSKLQRIPILNGLFAYNNYAIGTAKATLRAITDFEQARKTGNPVAMAHSARRLIYMLVGSLGAGLGGLMIRRALKGQPPKREDETWAQLAKRSLFEVALLGPTMRLLEAAEYANTAERLVIGTMPQVNAVVDLLGSALGYGIYGRFPAKERMGKWFFRQTPLAKGLMRWADRLAFPERQKHSKVRAMCERYKRDVLKRPRFKEEYQINPEYFAVREAAQTLDLEYAKKVANLYYESKEDKVKAQKGLRASLMFFRPIALNDEDSEAFLASLKPEERAMAEEIQRRYVEIVNEVAQSQGGGGGGNLTGKSGMGGKSGLGGKRGF